jgi:hypothetical protein
MRTGKKVCELRRPFRSDRFMGSRKGLDRASLAAKGRFFTPRSTVREVPDRGLSGFIQRPLERMFREGPKEEASTYLDHSPESIARNSVDFR